MLNLHLTLASPDAQDHPPVGKLIDVRGTEFISIASAVKAQRW